MTERIDTELAGIAAVSRPPDVHFGARDDDAMPHSWAERGLTWLYSERQNVFADMMIAVVGIEKTGRGSR